MTNYIPKPKYEVVSRVPFNFENKAMGRSPSIQLRNLDDKIRYHISGDRQFLDRN